MVLVPLPGFKLPTKLLFKDMKPLEFVLENPITINPIKNNIDISNYVH